VSAMASVSADAAEIVWQVECVEGDEEARVGQAVALTPETLLVESAQELGLVLRPGVLLPGATYVFRLRAWSAWALPDLADGAAASSAVTVVVNRAPQGGWVSVRRRQAPDGPPLVGAETVEGGLALESAYDVLAPGWRDEDGGEAHSPLRYQFWYEVEGPEVPQRRLPLTVEPVPFGSFPGLLARILPEGGTVRVSVEVHDDFRGVGRANFTLPVKPFALPGGGGCEGAAAWAASAQKEAQKGSADRAVSFLLGAAEVMRRATAPPAYWEARCQALTTALVRLLEGVRALLGGWQSDGMGSGEAVDALAAATEALSAARWHLDAEAQTGVIDLAGRLLQDSRAAVAAAAAEGVAIDGLSPAAAALLLASMDSVVAQAELGPNAGAASARTAAAVAVMETMSEVRIAGAVPGEAPQHFATSRLSVAVQRVRVEPAVDGAVVQSASTPPATVSLPGSLWAAVLWDSSAPATGRRRQLRQSTGTVDSDSDAVAAQVVDVRVLSSAVDPHGGRNVPAGMSEALAVAFLDAEDGIDTGAAGERTALVVLELPVAGPQSLTLPLVRAANISTTEQRAGAVPRCARWHDGYSTGECVTLPNPGPSGAALRWRTAEAAAQVAGDAGGNMTLELLWEVGNATLTAGCNETYEAVPRAAGNATLWNVTWGLGQRKYAAPAGSYAGVPGAPGGWWDVEACEVAQENNSAGCWWDWTLQVFLGEGCVLAADAECLCTRADGDFLVVMEQPAEWVEPAPPPMPPLPPPPPEETETGEGGIASEVSNTLAIVTGIVIGAALALTTVASHIDALKRLNLLASLLDASRGRIDTGVYFKPVKGTLGLMVWTFSIVGEEALPQVRREWGGGWGRGEWRRRRAQRQMDKALTAAGLDARGLVGWRKFQTIQMQMVAEQLAAEREALKLAAAAEASVLPRLPKPRRRPPPRHPVPRLPPPPSAKMPAVPEAEAVTHTARSKRAWSANTEELGLASLGSTYNGSLPSAGSSISVPFSLPDMSELDFGEGTPLTADAELEWAWPRTPFPARALAEPRAPAELEGSVDHGDEGPMAHGKELEEYRAVEDALRHAMRAGQGRGRARAAEVEMASAHDVVVSNVEEGAGGQPVLEALGEASSSARDAPASRAPATVEGAGVSGWRRRGWVQGSKGRDSMVEQARSCKVHVGAPGDGRRLFGWMWEKPSSAVVPAPSVPAWEIPGGRGQPGSGPVTEASEGADDIRSPPEPAEGGPASSQNKRKGKAPPVRKKKKKGQPAPAGPGKGQQGEPALPVVEAEPGEPGPKPARGSGDPVTIPQAVRKEALAAGAASGHPPENSTRAGEEGAAAGEEELAQDRPDGEADAPPAAAPAATAGPPALPKKGNVPPALPNKAKAAPPALPNKAKAAPPALPKKTEDGPPSLAETAEDPPPLAAPLAAQVDPTAEVEAVRGVTMELPGAVPAAEGADTEVREPQAEVAATEPASDTGSGAGDVGTTGPTADRRSGAGEGGTNADEEEVEYDPKKAGDKWRFADRLRSKDDKPKRARKSSSALTLWEPRTGTSRAGTSGAASSGPPSGLTSAGPPSGLMSGPASGPASAGPLPPVPGTPPEDDPSAKKFEALRELLGEVHRDVHEVYEDANREAQGLTPSVTAVGAHMFKQFKQAKAAVRLRALGLGTKPRTPPPTVDWQVEAARLVPEDVELSGGGPASDARLTVPPFRPPGAVVRPRTGPGRRGKPKKKFHDPDAGPSMQMVADPLPVLPGAWRPKPIDPLARSLGSMWPLLKRVRRQIQAAERVERAMHPIARPVLQALYLWQRRRLVRTLGGANHEAALKAGMQWTRREQERFRQKQSRIRRLPPRTRLLRRISVKLRVVSIFVRMLERVQDLRGTHQMSHFLLSEPGIVSVEPQPEAVLQLGLPVQDVQELAARTAAKTVLAPGADLLPFDRLLGTAAVLAHLRLTKGASKSCLTRMVRRAAALPWEAPRGRGFEWYVTILEEFLAMGLSSGFRFWHRRAAMASLVLLQNVNGSYDITPALASVLRAAPLALEGHRSSTASADAAAAVLPSAAAAEALVASIPDAEVWGEAYGNAAYGRRGTAARRARVWATLCAVSATQDLPLLWLTNPWDPPGEMKTSIQVAEAFLAAECAMNPELAIVINRLRAQAVMTYEGWAGEHLAAVKQLRQAVENYGGNGGAVADDCRRALPAMQQLSGDSLMLLHPWLGAWRGVPGNWWWRRGGYESPMRAHRLMVQGAAATLMLGGAAVALCSRAALCCAEARHVEGCAEVESAGYWMGAAPVWTDPCAGHSTCADLLATGRYECAELPVAGIIGHVPVLASVVAVVVTPMTLALNALFSAGTVPFVHQHLRWRTSGTEGEREANLATAVYRAIAGYTTAAVMNLAPRLSIILIPVEFLGQVVASWAIWALESVIWQWVAGRRAARFLYHTLWQGRDCAVVVDEMWVVLERGLARTVAEFTAAAACRPGAEDMEETIAVLAYLMTGISWSMMLLLMLQSSGEMADTLGSGWEVEVLRCWITALLVNHFVVHMLGRTLLVVVVHAMQLNVESVSQSPSALRSWYESHTRGAYVTYYSQLVYGEETPVELKT
ncbi:hypothetical protein CYMTET_11362, partial [Cymbomonas tetramitiformis]